MLPSFSARQRKAKKAAKMMKNQKSGDTDEQDGEEYPYDYGAKS